MLQQSHDKYLNQIVNIKYSFLTENRKRGMRALFSVIGSSKFCCCYKNVDSEVHSEHKRFILISEVTDIEIVLENTMACFKCR